MIDLDSVKIQNVVIVENKASGEIFFDKIFPHFTDCYLYSTDEFYPRNDELKNRVKWEIENNDELSIVLFSSDSYGKINIKSNRILILDKFISDFYSKTLIKSKLKQTVDEYFIVHILVSFFDQWKVLARPSNYSTYIRTASEFDIDSMGWISKLIAPNLIKCDNKVTIEVEDMEYLMFNQSNTRET